MNNLEKNNLDAQIKLMNDIISNNRSITYHITGNSGKLFELLKKGKLNEEDINNKTVTFSKENFDEIFDIVFNLKDEANFGKLGILAKTAVPDNKVKTELLHILQKQ